MSIAVSAQNVAECLRAMRSGGWSRNRYFEAHRTPAAQRARWLNRLLQSIERDLGQGGEVLGCERRPGGIALRLRNAALRLERELHLSEEELSLLVEVSPLLQRITARLDEGTRVAAQ